MKLLVEKMCAAAMGMQSYLSAVAVLRVLLEDSLADLLGYHGGHGCGVGVVGWLGEREWEGWESCLDSGLEIPL